MNRKNEIKKIIKLYFKDIKFKNVKYINNGYCNDILVIDDKLAFRFPKISYSVNILKNEKRVIDLIKKKTTIRVPDLKIVNDNKNLFCFYHFINGIEYGKIMHINDNFIREKIADQLAYFITNLHNIKTNSIKISRDILDFNLSTKINILLDFLKNNKDKDNLKKLIDYFDNYKLKEENLNLIHNDLTKNNIILNKDNFNLSGIIDFSNAMITDFNFEFAALFASDKKLALSVIKKYSKINSKIVDVQLALNIQKYRFYVYAYNLLQTNNIEEANNFINIRIPNLVI